MLGILIPHISNLLVVLIMQQAAGLYKFNTRRLVLKKTVFLRGRVR